MKILIDIDDTISNFSEVVLRRLNQLYLTHYKKEDINNWHWFKQTFHNPWLILQEKNFWDEIKIDKNAINFIEKIAQNGEEIYLVTASFFNDSLGYKIKKTLENFNEKIINESNIIVCNNKSMIKGDIRIDDGFHNLFEDSINILYSQPWNLIYDNSIQKIKFYRKNNWSEIEEFYKKINL